MQIPIQILNCNKMLNAFALIRRDCMVHVPWTQDARNYGLNSESLVYFLSLGSSGFHESGNHGVEGSTAKWKRVSCNPAAPPGHREGRGTG